MKNSKVRGTDDMELSSGDDEEHHPGFTRTDDMELSSGDDEEHHPGFTRTDDMELSSGVGGCFGKRYCNFFPKTQ